MKTYLLLLSLALAAKGQTSISNRTDLGYVDDSAAVGTKPAKSGASLPGTCSIGEFFYLTSASAGSNIYGCTSTNTWTLQGGSATVDATALKNAFLVPVSSGSGTAYAGTPTTAPSSYATGQIFIWKPDTTNTGTTPSLTVAGLGAKTIIHKSDSSAMAVSELDTAQYCTSLYNGTSMLTEGCFTGPGRLNFGVGAAPATPAANIGTVYVDSTSKNLAVKDDAGIIKHGVQTKAVVANQFLTGLSDAGVVSGAQPAASDLSNGTSGTGAVCLATGSACSSRSFLEWSQTIAPVTCSGVWQDIDTHTVSAATFVVGDVIHITATVAKAGTAAVATYLVNFGGVRQVANLGGSSAATDTYLAIDAWYRVAGANSEVSYGTYFVQSQPTQFFTAAGNGTSAISGAIVIALQQNCTAPDTGAATWDIIVTR